MTKGSANQFPYMTLTEQASAPDTPAAGDQKLFIDDADHLLYLVDENDTVTAVGSGGGGGTPATNAASLIFAYQSFR